MNNYMPLLLMLLLSMGKGGVSQDNLSAVMNMLGIDKNLPTLLSGMNFGQNANFQSDNASNQNAQNNTGGFTLEKILPMLLSSFANSANGGGSKQTATEKSVYEKGTEIQTASAPNYLLPIKEVAGDEINYALSHYFANN